MNSVIEKISSYNILNNLLPGAILCFMFEYALNFSILRINIIENLILFYFSGMVMSRVGSLVIEPIAKKLNLIHYSDYQNFVKAKQTDIQIDILKETNNVYRTFISVFLMLILLKIYKPFYYSYDILQLITPWVVIILLFIIFVASYRKQTNYVNSRINEINKIIERGEV